MRSWLWAFFAFVAFVTNFFRKIEMGSKTFLLLAFEAMALSEAIAMHYYFISMFVHHRAHKGPRLEARPWLMAAFYNFKAAVSDFR